MPKTEVETEAAETTDAAGSTDTAKTQVQEADFAEAQQADVKPSEENLDLLLDIHMPLTVNLGTTTMQFRKLLQLGPGSIIQLDKLVGEPADLYIQDIKFATADIVVAGDSFAVRIKEISGMEQTVEAARNR